MKAWRLHEFDSPMVYETVEDPVITDPYDVIVKIGGAGVCHTDIHQVKGLWANTHQTELPFTIGHENAGWISQIGSAVTDFDIGDPVLVHPVISCGICMSCRIGEDMHCENRRFPGMTEDGGYAEYLKTSARSLIRLPRHVNPADVAPLSDGGVTAYRVMRKASALSKPGTYAVVLGVGGVGQIGIQVMRELGSSLIVVVDQSTERLGLARELGADYAVRSGEACSAEIMAITSGRGADIVIDCVGTTDTHRLSMDLLRKGGTYFVVGYGGTISVDSMHLIHHEISIVGNLAGNYSELDWLVQLYLQGKVKVPTIKYPLTEANTVLQLLEAGQISGRAVLVP